MIYLVYLELGELYDPLLIGVANLETEVMKLKAKATKRFYWMESPKFSIVETELNKLLD